MLTDVPTEAELAALGRGWLNLAWERAISTLREMGENEEYYSEMEEALSPAEKSAYWDSQSFKLNNATALTQQAIEIILKSRIAAVDPLRLLESAKVNTGSFTYLKTHRASKLCGIVTQVTSTALPSGFEEFFKRMNNNRNRVLHLSAGTTRPEVRSVLKDILQAFTYLYPTENWVQLRREHLQAEDVLRRPYDDDWTHATLMNDLRFALDELPAADVKRFLGFDVASPAFVCPECFERLPKRADDVVYLAQHDGVDRVACIACGSCLPKPDYDLAVEECWGEEVDENVYERPHGVSP